MQPNMLTPHLDLAQRSRMCGSTSRHVQEQLHRLALSLPTERITLTLEHAILFMTSNYVTIINGYYILINLTLKKENFYN